MNCPERISLLDNNTYIWWKKNRNRQYKLMVVVIFNLPWQYLLSYKPPRIIVVMNWPKRISFFVGLFFVLRGRKIAVDN